MRFVTEFFRDLRTPLYRNAIFLMANTAVGSGLSLTRANATCARMESSGVRRDEVAHFVKDLSSVEILPVSLSDAPRDTVARVHCIH